MKYASAEKFEGRLATHVSQSPTGSELPGSIPRMGTQTSTGFYSSIDNAQRQPKKSKVAAERDRQKLAEIVQLCLNDDYRARQEEEA